MKTLCLCLDKGIPSKNKWFGLNFQFSEKTLKYKLTSTLWYSVFVAVMFPRYFYHYIIYQYSYFKKFQRVLHIDSTLSETVYYHNYLPEYFGYKFCVPMKQKSSCPYTKSILWLIILSGIPSVYVKRLINAWFNIFV